MKRFALIAALLFRALAAGTALGQPATPASPPKVGINLMDNTYWNPSETWTNAFNVFNGYSDVSNLYAPPATPLKLNAAGVPVQDWGTISQMNGYPEGTYNLSYQGKGTVSLSWLTAIVPDTTHFDPATDTTTAKVQFTHYPGYGSWAYAELKVTGNSPTDPVHNVHLDLPGQKDPVFTDQFLKRVQPFNGPIRTMDWLTTNANDSVNWSDRTPADGPQGSWAHRGVAWENVVALANKTNKDVWINVPAKAGDDYVKRLANLWATSFTGKGHLYVEYGNEDWNALFPQYQYTYDLAQKDPRFAAESNPWGKQADYIAVKSMEVGQVFTNAFQGRADGGKAADGKTAVRVELGTQAAQLFWDNTGLKYVSDHYGAPKNFFHGEAIAPYGGIEEAVDKPGLTLEQYFASRAVGGRTGTSRRPAVPASWAWTTSTCCGRT